MRVIPPITLNSTNVVSNAPPTNDPSAWSAVTTYYLGNTVQIAGTVNKIYECLATSITGGFSPEIDVTKSIPKWIEVGPINKYKMFDNLGETYTTATTSLTVTITPGMAVAALAITHLINVTNVTLNGYVTYPTSVWTKSFSPDLNYPNASTIYFDTPSNATIYILVFTGTGSFYVGNVVVGNTYYNLGKLQNNTTIDSLNFSTMDRDSYGTAQLLIRRSVNKIQHKTAVNSEDLYSLKSIKDHLNAVTAVWSGLDDNSTHPYFNALVTLGFYREFSFEVDNPIGPMVNIEIEEV